VGGTIADWDETLDTVDTDYLSSRGHYNAWLSRRRRSVTVSMIGAGEVFALTGSGSRTPVVLMTIINVYGHASASVSPQTLPWTAESAPSVPKDVGLTSVSARIPRGTPRSRKGFPERTKPTDRPRFDPCGPPISRSSQPVSR
jgi:hypothetical protein